MTITNDERREVAARLRNLNSNLWSCYSEEYDDLRLACNADKYYKLELHELLADLIEPEPERMCQNEPPMSEERERNGFLCTACGYKFGTLLNWGKFNWNYCPNCGRKVID